MKRLMLMVLSVIGIFIAASCSKSGEKSYLTVSPVTMTVSSSATEITITVNSSGSYTSSIVQGAGWITKSTSASIKGAVSEVYKISEATIDGSRIGKIVYLGSGLTDTVKIMQSQKDLIEFTSGTSTFDYKGGTFSVKLRSNTDYSFSLENTPSWISYVETKAVSTSLITFTIAKNYSGADRVGKLICTDKNNANVSDTIVVTQQTVPFLKETTSGIYNYDGNDANLKYAQYSDQYAIRTSGTAYSFILQNVFNDVFCEFGGIPVNLDNEQKFDVTVKETYASGVANGTYSVTVLKSDPTAGNYWLFNESKGVGFIVKK